MSCNILVADDEKELADVLELYLVRNSYTVHKSKKNSDIIAVKS